MGDERRFAEGEVYINDFGKVRAVDGISFAVNEGEIFGFLGPNGAGKTTTIRCLMDFLRPDEDSIKILPKHNLGFLSEEVHLYEDWTGKEHIDLIKKIRGGNINESHLLAQLDFNPQKKVKTLSSGNKQKLGLILALLHQPKVLILDEPTKGLDPLLQKTIYEILKAEAKKGAAIFMSSHNLYEVERICGRVGIIKNGKLVTVEDISEERRKEMPRSRLEKVFMDFYR